MEKQYIKKCKECGHKEDIKDLFILIENDGAESRYCHYCIITQMSEKGIIHINDTETGRLVEW